MLINYLEVSILTFCSLPVIHFRIYQLTLENRSQIHTVYFCSLKSNYHMFYGRKEDINLTRHEPDTCRVNELQVEYYLNSSEHLAQKA